MRQNQRSDAPPQSAAHVQGSGASQSEVDRQQRGLEHNAEYDLAHVQRVVTVPSCKYSSEVAEQISRLRQERWAILSHFDASVGRKGYSHTNEYKGYQQRLDVVSAELYILTENPIYDVDGKARLFAAQLQQS